MHDDEPEATNAEDFDELPLARVAGLPTRVDMRDNTSSYNREWEVTLKRRAAIAAPATAQKNGASLPCPAACAASSSGSPWTLRNRCARQKRLGLHHVRGPRRH
ncbi:MAG: hypothetical protein U1U88_002070 [Lawsonella clevelandensis]